jgi:DNA-binding NarL/FixJ family response regulator
MPNSKGSKPPCNDVDAAERYRIVLADDHALFRDGLRMLLEGRYEVIGEAGDGIELLELLKTATPDLVILDVSMPRMRGIETVREIKAVYPEMKALILTMHCENEYVESATAAGADGYLLKEDAHSELFDAVEQIRVGRLYLSPSLGEDVIRKWAEGLQAGIRHSFNRHLLSNREREVLKLIAEGRSNKEVAALLYISVRTVEHHRASIMSKLNVRKTAELVTYAIQNNFV